MIVELSEDEVKAIIMLNSAGVNFLENIALPSEVSAAYIITQDNTGLVTITPSANNASSFDVFLGDGTTDPVSPMRDT